MKKLLLLLLPLLTVILVHAQSYIPFPTANTIWREQFRRSIEDPYTIHNYGMKDSDTLINNITYHKLYKSTDTVFDESELNGFMREDTQKRVFYRLIAATGGPETDKLMYDFSLQPGDILQANDNNGMNNWMVTMQVTQVDSININGIYHRRISFNWPKSSWVEGIGNSIRGLLFYSGTWPNNGQWNDLICLGQNGNWIFHNAASVDPPFTALPDCDENLVGINDYTRLKEAVVFHPLPVVGTSVVYLSNGEKISTLDIYDITGKKVKNCPGNGTGRVSVYRNDYVPGIYCYRLSTGNGARASGRFVVQ